MSRYDGQVATRIEVETEASPAASWQMWLDLVQTRLALNFERASKGHEAWGLNTGTIIMCPIPELTKTEANALNEKIKAIYDLCQRYNIGFSFNQAVYTRAGKIVRTFDDYKTLDATQIAVKCSVNHGAAFNPNQVRHTFETLMKIPAAPAL